MWEGRCPKDSKDSRIRGGAAGGGRTGFPMGLLFAALAAGMLALPFSAHAVKTAEVLLGNDGVYDNAVAIARDDAGRMTFRDSQITSPTTLWILHGSATSHSSLSNLGADDHLQYLNDARHHGAHSAEFNSAFAIPPDVAGNTTLGGHVADADLHLRRDADETISGEWTFPSLKIAGDRVLTVDPNGAGEFATIHDALAAAAAMTPPPSAASRVVVRVGPGTYAEQGLELPDYVDLIGVSREGCVISMSSTNYDSSDARSSALVSAPGNSLVANLTINNTRSIYPSTALNLGWGWAAGSESGKTCRAINCDFKGGAQDILYTSGNNVIRVENCSVYTSKATEVTDAISIVPLTGATHWFSDVTVEAEGFNALWITAPGTAVFDRCTFWAKQTSTEGIIRFGDSSGTGSTARFNQCAFLTGATPALGKVMADSEATPAGAGTTGVNVYLSRCAYSSWNYAGALITLATEDMGDGDVSFGGDVTVTGAVSGGTAEIGDGILMGGGNVDILKYQPTGLDYPFFQIWYDGVSSMIPYIQFGDATGAVDTNLYRGSANNLKTDDAFDAAGLSSTATQWRYFDAVSCAAGALPYAAADVLTFPEAWWQDAATGATHITTSHDAIQTYVPVPYEAGTVVTRISVRWQGVGANDGVIVTFQKRQGGTASAAWTTVGAAQTYTGTSETNSVYDLADETFAAGYAYRVVVESQVATTGARLWEIGIETGKRAY